MDFVTWVESEMKKREWSQADLARKGGLTSAQVSRVLSRLQNPGQVFFEGIARAFDVTLEEVYRHANRLPPVEPKTARQKELEHLIKQVPDSVVLELIEFLRFRTRKK